MKLSALFLSSFVALALAQSLTPTHANAAVVDRLEASVNSSLILLSDVRKFRETVKLRSQIDPLFNGTTVAAKGASASDAEIVEFLINERLISAQFAVTDAEVESEINQIQANNKISRESLKSALETQGFEFSEYFELIRSGASKRNLIDRDIRTKVTISDDDVKNYFYNHYSKQAQAPSAFHIQVITVSTKNYKSPAAAQDTAKRALQEIRAGEPFEEVAKRVSDDVTASSGGDLGTLSEDQMAPALRDQAKKLKIGEISEVFGATNGFYILKLVDVKTGDSDRYERMKDEIRNQLASTEYQHQISIWLDRQRQSSFIHRVGEAATAGIALTR